MISLCMNQTILIISFRTWQSKRARSFKVINLISLVLRARFRDFTNKRCLFQNEMKIFLLFWICIIEKKECLEILKNGRVYGTETGPIKLSKVSLPCHRGRINVFHTSFCKRDDVYLYFTADLVNQSRVIVPFNLIIRKQNIN